MPTIGQPAETLWTMTGRRFTDRSRAPLPDRVDTVVIGGGFTGLTAALELLRARRSVVLLEAGWLASGASAASAGVVATPFAKANPAFLHKRLPKEKADRLLVFMGEAPDIVFRIIEREEIECDARQLGWLQPSFGRRMTNRLRDWAAEWLAIGRPVEFMSAEELRMETGIGKASGAFLDRSGGTIHPVNYIAGLAMAVYRRGGMIREMAAAHRLDPSPLGWRVEFDGGMIVADSVILATNAFTEGLAARLGRLGAPFHIHQIASRPLDLGTVQRIAANRRPVGDLWTHPLTYRLDARNRLITGGMSLYAQNSLDRLQSQAISRLGRFLPFTDYPGTEAAWNGIAMLTPDLLPHVYRFEDGVFGGLACNGFGIAMSAQLGRVLARLALGARPEAMPIPVAPTRRLLLPGLEAGARLAGRRMGQFMGR